MAKITTEELESLQQALTKVNQAKILFSDISLQAHYAKLEVLKLNEALAGVQSGLEAKYGNISVDVSTGEYQEVVEEAEEA